MATKYGYQVERDVRCIRPAVTPERTLLWIKMQLVTAEIATRLFGIPVDRARLLDRLLNWVNLPGAYAQVGMIQLLLKRS